MTSADPRPSPGLDPEMLRAWRGMLAAHARVIRGLEDDMLEQHGLPLTWFDALSRLRQAPDKRLRMHELEAVSLLTRSGMTRLADRLEEAGLVRRERAPEDRRGVYLAITAAGEARIDEVWPDHQRSIQDHFARHLDVRDARSLQRVAARLVGDDAAILALD